MSTASLVESLTHLRDALRGVRLPLGLPGSVEADRAARDMVAQLDDYILPRLATLDAPLLAVIGGSTGAGKSTLINSLIGRVVSRPGVIRPTTKSPVLVHNPADLEFFQSDRVLPGLARSFQQANDTSTLQLVAEPSLPPGLALLDAPDIDSVASENRALAAQLLAAADLWLFVTTAARYADAVPWEYLKSAADRSAAVAVVLQRVPPAAMHDVPTHLGRLMTERGLGTSPLFAVPETTTDAAGLLPDAAVAPIRDWLATLASDKASRQAVVMQTLDGAIGSLTARTPAVLDGLHAQGEAREQLLRDAETSYADAVRAIEVQTADGSMLRGEVLSRWQDFVGTGEFMRNVETRIGWLRDRIVGAFKGEPDKTDRAEQAVTSSLETLLHEQGNAAAERAENAWMGAPAGRQILAATHEDLSRSSVSYDRDVAQLVRDWQGDVLALVTEEGADKKAGARIMAFGVNGIGLVLMFVVFSMTGGLTGAEVGIAGGTVVLAQRFLEAIFGDDGVRRMAKRAKESLDARVEAALAAELDRYRRALDAVGLDVTRAEAVDAALTELRVERAGGARLDAPADRRALDAEAPAVPVESAPAIQPATELRRPEVAPEAPAAIAPAVVPIVPRSTDIAPERPFALDDTVDEFGLSRPKVSDADAQNADEAGEVRLGGGGIVLPSELDRGFRAPDGAALEGTVLDETNDRGTRVERHDD